MATQALTLINGRPQMATVSTVTAIYDQTFAAVANYSSGTLITLPNGGVYQNKDLRVYLNGAFWEANIDYTYPSGSPPFTQIEILQNIVLNDSLHFRINQSANPLTIYDQVIIVNSTITTGTNITLPSSQTYSDVELEVYLNGQLMQSVVDYNYVGALPPRTQIAMTFDLIAGDRLRFRMGD
jgi:hypothetical protein